jgi:DNA-binding MarR family transcriptional regulator
MSRSRPSLSDSDYRSLAEFRYLLRQFLAFSENAARKVGLEPQKHQALLAIRGFGGNLTVGELAQKLLIKPHSAVGLVDRLVEAGFVRRSAGMADRRKVTLSLTATAEKLLGSLSEAHRKELTRLASSLRPMLDNWEGA